MLAKVSRRYNRSQLLDIEDLACALNLPCRAKLGDVNILVRTGGRYRTREE